MEPEIKRSLWIVNQHAPGPGRHEYMARELAARGWRVTLFAASFVHNYGIERRRYPPGCDCLQEDSGGVKRVWIKTPAYRGNGWSRLYNHLVFALRTGRAGIGLEPPGIVIGSTAHLPACLAAYRLARRHGVPFIFEMRDFSPRALVDIGAVRRFNPLVGCMGALEKYLCRKARRIISVLPGGGDYMSVIGADASRVTHIPNGVDPGWFDRHAAAIKPHSEEARFFQQHSDEVVFTYSGAHGYANGLETVVGAAVLLQQAGVKGIHILLVGSGPAKDGLVRAARENGLTNVTFMQAVDKDRVPAILARSDVCIFHLRGSRAYRYGLSPNKLYEYMAAARPVIAAADNLPVPDFSRFGRHIPSDDPRALAGAVIDMCYMPGETRARLGLGGRIYFEQFHATPVLVDKLEALLLGVL